MALANNTVFCSSSKCYHHIFVSMLTEFTFVCFFTSSFGALCNILLCVKMKGPLLMQLLWLLSTFAVSLLSPSLHPSLSMDLCFCLIIYWSACILTDWPTLESLIHSYLRALHGFQKIRHCLLKGTDEKTAELLIHCAQTGHSCPVRRHNFYSAELKKHYLLAYMDRHGFGFNRLFILFFKLNQSLLSTDLHGNLWGLKKKTPG